MANAIDIALQNTIERISGAIIAEKELNIPNNLKFPCSICNKNCLKNQLAILCDGCDKWCHLKCDATTTVEQYKFFEETEGDPTTEDKVDSFIRNVEITDYKLHSTPSLSLKGGAALYVSSRFDAPERTDLNIQNEDFESVGRN